MTTEKILGGQWFRLKVFLTSGEVEDETVVAYEFYWLDSTGGCQIIGVLPERRKAPERITHEYILNWGKKFFPKDLVSKNIFFLRVTIDDRTGQVFRPVPLSVIRKEIPE